MTWLVLERGLARPLQATILGMSSPLYLPENLFNPHGGSCIVWPAPDLGCVPCATLWEPEDFKLWLPAVNQQAFEDFGSRFPGCCCHARIRVCRPCVCACPCGCRRDGVDLWPTLRYPANQVVGFELDGVWQDEETIAGKWELHQNRYLIAKDGIWPVNHGAPGGECAWSVVVQYGQNPPPIAVLARDEELMRLMAIHCPTVAGCSISEGTVSLSENGRTRNFDIENPSRLYEVQRARYEIGAERHSMVDPAEFAGISETFVEALALGDWPGIPEESCVGTDEQIDGLFAELEAAAGDEEPFVMPAVDPVTGLPV